VRIGARRRFNGVGSGADRGRAQRGVLGRWWAGRPASPQTVERTRWYRRRFWTAPTPSRASKGIRGATKAGNGGRSATKVRDGDSRCHQGARWSRGRPESPHKSTRSPTRHWRCRPARPPTPRNPALRAAPRCVDPHPSATPPCVSTHPSCTPTDVMDGKLWAVRTGHRNLSWRQPRRLEPTKKQGWSHM
jgi:hypothetical protein